MGKFGRNRNQMGSISWWYWVKITNSKNLITSLNAFFWPRSTVFSLSFLVVLFYSCSFIEKYFGQFGLCKAEKQQFAIEKFINSVIGNRHKILIKSSCLTYRPRTKLVTLFWVFWSRWIWYFGSWLYATKQYLIFDIIKVSAKNLCTLSGVKRLNWRRLPNVA